MRKKYNLCRIVFLLKGRFKMLKVFLFFCTVFSTFSFATENEELMVSQSFIYQQIVEKQPDAVFFCTEERLYLRPEKVILTDRGIFVGEVEIPTLHSDTMGCYVLSKSSGKWVCCTRDCPNFRNTFRNESGYCPGCGRKGLRYDD